MRDACRAFTDRARPLIEVPRTDRYAPVSIAVFDPFTAESVLDGLPFASNTCDRPSHTIAVVAELANGRMSAGYLHAAQVAGFAPAALPADPRKFIDFVHAWRG